MLVIVTLLFSFFAVSFGGELLDSVKFDQTCTGATLHSIRITDCDAFPCVVKRGKNYTVDAEFSLEKKIEKIVVKCGTIYLGKQHNLPGYGGCETVTNGTCPLDGEVIYNTFTSFVIPYYVPPIHYNVACTLLDNDGNKLLCGSGSGRVV